MATSPFVVDKFGGLDLFNDPQELGPTSAIDLLNVDLDVRGRVRSRDGSTALTSAAGSPHTQSLHATTAVGTEELIGRVGNTLTAYALSGGASALTQVIAGSTSNNSFTNIGVPGGVRTYIGAGTLYRYGAAGFTGVGAAPISPTLVASTANDNRLVIGDGTDQLSFSDAGAPETFGASNFVRLWPGDGETMTGLIRWRDLLFAFKQTRFAVFTGTSVDSAGNPVFNYRGVDAGRGCYAAGMAVAGEEGVYFADSTGIYLTAGDTPRYISAPIEPWLKAGSFGSLPAFSLTGGVALVYHERRLYVTYTNNASSVTLVFDPQMDAWSVWQLGAVSIASVPRTYTGRGLYFGEFTSKKIAKVDTSVATDQGSAVSWSWTSAPYDVGYPGQVKITLESRLWGLGTVTLKVANDYAAFDTGSALTLGTSPTVADAWQQFDREGTLWQHKLSGTGAATVSRLAHYVSFVKPVGVG